MKRKFILVDVTDDPPIDIEKLLHYLKSSAWICEVKEIEV